MGDDWSESQCPCKAGSEIGDFPSSIRAYVLRPTPAQILASLDRKLRFIEARATILRVVKTPPPPVHEFVGDGNPVTSLDQLIHFLLLQCSFMFESNFLPRWLVLACFLLWPRCRSGIEETVLEMLDGSGSAAGAGRLS